MRRIALATALVAVTVTGPVHAAAPTCGGEPATVVGTSGPDVLIGGDGADELCGRGGDGEIEAEARAVYRGDLCEPR